MLYRQASFCSRACMRAGRRKHKNCPASAAAPRLGCPDLPAVDPLNLKYLIKARDQAIVSVHFVYCTRFLSILCVLLAKSASCSA